MPYLLISCRKVIVVTHLKLTNLVGSNQNSQTMRPQHREDRTSDEETSIKETEERESAKETRSEEASEETVSKCQDGDGEAGDQSESKETA